MRGLRVAIRPAKAQPPHPNPLPAFGGPKVRLSRQRKLCLRVSGGERGLQMQSTRHFTRGQPLSFGLM
ncbi:hypothetical protein TSH58p_32440 (plasmid) [Azospirillum sp. TSH58]|nr:hypothetical protein TSH58p_32440 [Azospirillum sp. TSH58]